MTENITFRFTRHGYSCNNINITYVEKAIKSDFDPSITSWAIMETFEHGKINKGYFNSNKVYVSCLIRTWMSAVLLYIHHINDYLSDNKVLYLNIIPFLKEKHKGLLLKGLDTGNYPDKLFNQINKFHDFLKYSIKLLRDSKMLFQNLTIIIKSLDLYTITFNIDENYEITIKINDIDITKINNIYKAIMIKKNIDLSGLKLTNVELNDHYINYLIQVKNHLYSTTETKTENESTIERYSKLTLILNSNKIDETKYKQYKNKYNDNVNEKNYEYSGLIFYEKERNLNYFINWFIDNKLYNDNEITSQYNYENNQANNTVNERRIAQRTQRIEDNLPSETFVGGETQIFSSKNLEEIISNSKKIIHCVSHSRVMQQFLFSLLSKNNKKTLQINEYFKKLTDTNSWSIQLNINTSKYIDNDNIYILYGVEKPETIKDLSRLKKLLKKKLFSNKNIYSIQNCENLCYTSKTKKLIINKGQCNKKVDEYTKKNLLSK